MKMKQRKTIGLQQTVFHFAVYMRTENEMRLELHLMQQIRAMHTFNNYRSGKPVHIRSVTLIYAV